MLLTGARTAFWCQRARKALDSWGGGVEFSVAVALQDAYRDWIKRAAAFVEEHGQRELAAMIRKLAEETKVSP